ncbi:MAG TPA: hypothetical protein VHP30_05385 [Ignavibacteriales bacterium]|nr:hypothetical protein [Ignavibacteriales bacterium]
MKKLFYILIAISAVFFFSCSDDDNPIGEILGTTITAKSKIADVQTTAKTGFASDAKISAIYGRNVGKNGTVDFLSLDSTVTGFVYIVNSSSKADTKAYIPLPIIGVVESPVSIGTMLSYINDATTKSALDGMLKGVASVSFEDAALTACYDSPAAITKALTKDEVSAFMRAHQDAKIDVLLVPSLSLTSGSTADWIVHLYAGSLSKVVWIHTETVLGQSMELIEVI